MPTSKRLETGERLLRAALVIGVSGSAVGEALRVDAVTRSLQTLGYPLYVLPILAFTKACAVVVLVAPVPRWLREWGYAGLVFDFALATYSFICLGRAHFPDVVLAPTYLVLALASFAAHRARDA